MRYPKGGKGSKWTIRELQSISDTWKNDTLSDGNGLTGAVRCSRDGAISVRFQYPFKWEGKLRWYQCGTWPTIDLIQIRQNRDDARTKIKNGLNPITDKTAAQIKAQAEREATIANAAAEKAQRKTVQNLFDEWIVDGVARKDGNAELTRLFRKEVLPNIGTLELRHLTEQHIRLIIRKLIDRGVVRQAVVTFKNIVQMLHWGEKRQPWRSLLINGNPAELIDLELLLPDDYTEVRDRLLSNGELRELSAIFASLREEYGATPAGNKYGAVRPMKRESELAVWICLGTLCRIGELLMAEWKDVDLQAKTWFIPKTNVKGRRAQRQDHVVFLSNFAMQQFVC